MKKSTLFLFLFVAGFTFSQNNNYVYDLTNDHGLIETSTFLSGPGDENSCRPEVNAWAQFSQPLNIYFNNYDINGSPYQSYNTFSFKIYGVSDTNTTSLIATKYKSFDNYEYINGFGYIYRMYPNEIGEMLDTSVEYVQYYSEIEIKQYVYSWDELGSGMQGYIVATQDSKQSLYKERCESPTGGGGDGGTGDGGGTGGGLPNLTLEKITVQVGTTTYDTSASTNNIPIFKNGSNHTFNITIKNNGGGDASSVKYSLLVSTSSNAYPYITSTPVYTFHNLENAGNISGNSQVTDTFSEYIYNYISSLQLQENTTYYMFLDIDPNNEINETNENINDNIWYIQFKYDDPSTSGSIGYLDLGTGIIEIPLDDINTSNITYNLKINSLSVSDPSTPTVVQNVVNNQTINVSFLPQGYYAVYVNDEYVKKFKKLTGPILE